MLFFFVFLVLAIESCSGDWPGSSRVCSENDFLKFPCECTQQRVDCHDRDIEILSSKFVLPNKTWIGDFSRNKLKEIKKVEFGQISSKDESVRALDLSQNLIENIEANSFENFPVLESLDLSRNQLKNLSENVFANLSNLETLDLSKNQIRFVRMEWFADLKKLNRLDLSYNPIGLSEMPMYTNMFSHLQMLEFLNLANCSIQTLPLNIFENNSRLTELSLARNPLSQVPVTQLYSVRLSLEFLDLTGTEIKSIKNHDFHGLTLLKKLILNDLRFLEHIGPLGFHALDALEVLECQNNKQLKSIDPFAFRDDMEQTTGPNKVLEVYLNNNGLTTVSKSLLDYKNAESIQFNGNPLSCDCRLQWMALEFRSEIPALDFSEFLVCATPETLKNFPIKHLRKIDFNCPDETGLEWIPTVVLSAALIVIILVVMFIGYFCILKKYFPHLVPNTPVTRESKTRLVFHFERLFHKSHPNVKNMDSYKPLNPTNFNNDEATHIELRQHRQGSQDHQTIVH